MTATRYFTTMTSTGGTLARVGDGVAERVTTDQPEWLDLPSLYHLVFDCDLNWDEVDRAGAAAFLDALGMDADLLDEREMQASATSPTVAATNKAGKITLDELTGRMVNRRWTALPEPEGTLEWRDGNDEFDAEIHEGTGEELMACHLSGSLSSADYSHVNAAVYRRLDDQAKQS